MSQNSVLKFLKRHRDRWHNLKALNKGMGHSSSIAVSLRKLREFNMVLFKKQVDPSSIKKAKVFYYKHKR